MNDSFLLRIWGVSSVLLLFLIPVSFLGAALPDYSKLKIAPAPGGGMYIGQYDWQPGDIATFEQAIGRKAAWFSPYTIGEMDDDGHPVFFPEKAERAWRDGKVVMVQAYEAQADPGEVLTRGFTVDKLLRGTYEPQLKRLAAQFRQFGKPIFFSTAREPNGIGMDNYMGGFGPQGKQSVRWAVENRKGFAEFTPSIFPNSKLYKGLGDPAVCDGLERLAAAQRYYYDFFVRREGLTFLTFDTMGWAMHPENVAERELEDAPAGIDRSHALRLLESCSKFENFYPGDAYVDWVSINFYMLDYHVEDWKEFEEDIIVPYDYYLDILASSMAEIRQAASGKPVFFLEFGMPDGMKKNSARAAEKITVVFDELFEKYPEIGGFSMWSFHPFWSKPDGAVYFPWDSLIRPGTAQAAAFRKIIQDHPGGFHSCVFFSDGSQIPTCPKNVSIP